MISFKEYALDEAVDKEYQKTVMRLNGLKGDERKKAIAKLDPKTKARFMKDMEGEDDKNKRKERY